MSRPFRCPSEPNLYGCADNVPHRMAAAIQGAGVIVWQQDRELRYIWINSVILGLDPEQLIGKTDEQVLDAEDAPAVVALKRRVLATGMGDRAELRLSRDGLARFYEMTIEPVHDEHRQLTGLAGVAIDVTLRRNEEARQRFRMLFSDSLRELDDPQRVMSMSARALGEHFGANRVGYLEVDTAKGTMRVDADYHREVESMGGTYPVSALGSHAEATLKQNRTLVVPDVSLDAFLEPETVQQLQRVQVRSLTAVPLVRDGRLIAVLVVHQRTPRAWSSADVDLIEEVAQRTRQAVERARAERDLRALNETLEQRVAERTAVSEHQAAQLRALASELTQVEQRERRRLAQTLHDHLQQLLVAAKLRLNALSGRVDEEGEQALRLVDDLLSRSVNSARSLSVELSPPILHDAGLPASLEWLARWMHDKHNLNVTTHLDPTAELPDADMRVFVFNAVRELLFNVVKHAGTRDAHVELALLDPQHIRIIVQDQGNGFDVNGSSDDRTGWGLFGIQQRLGVLGGHMTITSEPGRGTCIEMLAPRDPAPVST
ncbi:MAG: GAF domain-containing protein [Phycisphaeraceae bacterium]